MPVHIAVDLGASSGRVIAGGIDGGRLKLKVASRFPNGPVRIQDSLVWNHIGLWEAILTGLRSCHAAQEAAGSPIRSVGVDTWGVDYALLGANEEIVSPVRNYRDPRNRGMVEAAFDVVPRSEIFAQTGLQFMEINTLYQLIAGRRAGDPAWKTAESFVMVADLFHWLLTGRRTIEASNASTTQLLNPSTGRWATGLMDQFEIPSPWFSDPIPAGTRVGNVQASVAATTGLHDIPVIAPATHDTASAVLAVPAETFAPENPNWCYISSGTWSLMGVETPSPIINDLCSELNFTNEGGVQGSTRLLKNIGGLWVLQQIRVALQRRGKEPTWDSMVQEASNAQAFQLLLNPDAEAFVAPDDMIDAICSYAGISGQPVPTNDATLFRAALEGLALRYRACLGSLERLTGSAIETIHIVGGGSQNALLCQMTADACHREVVAGPVEATAIGNVLMQMIGTEQIQGIDQARELVRASFGVQRYYPEDPHPYDEAAERFDALPH